MAHSTRASDDVPSGLRSSSPAPSVPMGSALRTRPHILCFLSCFLRRYAASARDSTPTPPLMR
jgi:hypothetical protein